MELSLIAGSMNFLPYFIVDNQLHDLYLRANPGLTIHVEKKPQTKHRPQENQRQTTIMNRPLLLLIPPLLFWVLGKRQCRNLSNILPALITIVVALG
jgi:hypothetical protein